jgi:hypothetical protein
MRLLFAEYDGAPLSGILCIGFGKTFTLWKRGWNGREGKRHPNERIPFEALKWAVQNGYEFCDYSTFDERMAETIQNGEPLSPEQERSRYCFITRFGGMPRFLQEPRLFLPNPFVQSAVMLFHTGLRKVRKGGRSPC